MPSFQPPKTELGHVYPLGKETLLAELRVAKEAIARWEAVFAGFREGEPLSEEEVAQALNAFPGEMMLLSAKAQGLAQAAISG